MTPQTKRPGTPPPWPALRRGLGIEATGHDASGAPMHVLKDPVQGRYVRLSGTAACMLDNWNLADSKSIAEASACQPQEVEMLRDALAASRLTVCQPGDSQELLRQSVRQQGSIFTRVIHGYLSIRIPLINPEPMLDRLLPLVRSLVRPIMMACVLLVGFIGAYFASRQWDVFVATARDSLSLAGAWRFALTLFVVKLLHEVGHGLVARAMGCRVPTMGVAIMVMAPMLYTETTDAWRLKSRWQRFAVAGAGVAVELILAAVALFVWAFAPEGPLRAMAFFVAITSMVMSLAVNLSPFMRFDGYHMLSDALAMPGLAGRSFALGSWRIRRLLLATREPPPEVFSPAFAAFLQAFAMATWLYRLGLFLGIAWLVYSTFPRVIGLPMACVEIYYFLLRPTFKEVSSWFSPTARAAYGARHVWITGSLIAILALLALLPLDRSVRAPAILLPAEEAWVYPPEPALLQDLRIKPGSLVRKGDVIAVLRAPELEGQLAEARAKLALAEQRMRQARSGTAAAQDLLSLQQEREAALQEYNGLSQRLSLLIVRAPISGRLSTEGSTIEPGMWLGRQDMIAHLHALDGALVSGLLAERFTSRIDTGAVVRFVSEDGLLMVSVATLTGIGQRGAEGRTADYLSTENGGEIVMGHDQLTGRATPDAGYLPFRASVGGPSPERTVRGTAIVQAEPRSLASIILGRIATVMLRESGF